MPRTGTIKLHRTELPATGWRFMQKDMRRTRNEEEKQKRLQRQREKRANKARQKSKAKHAKGKLHRQKQYGATNGTWDISAAENSVPRKQGPKHKRAVKAPKELTAEHLQMVESMYGNEKNWNKKHWFGAPLNSMTGDAEDDSDEDASEQRLQVSRPRYELQLSTETPDADDALVLREPKVQGIPLSRFRFENANATTSKAKENKGRGPKRKVIKF